MSEDILKIMDSFSEKKIIVIGDVMIDKYIWGKVNRISPEAPVQVVDVKKESYFPGGAANVACLGGKVYVVGIVGDDIEGELLIGKMKRKKIFTEGVIIDVKKVTSQKIRIMGDEQQLLRIDKEQRDCVGNVNEDKIINFVKEKILDVDVIIISDYAKGIVTKNLMERLIEMCKKNSKKIIVDPKPKNKKHYFGVDVVAPNHIEAMKMAGAGINGDVDKIGFELVKEIDSNVLITRGKKGMSFFSKHGGVVNIPTVAKEVFDVTGAGDTVMAVLALVMACGANYEVAANIANHAAGIVVGKVGTSSLSLDELKCSFS